MVMGRVFHLLEVSHSSRTAALRNLVKGIKKEGGVKVVTY